LLRDRFFFLFSGGCLGWFRHHLIAIFGNIVPSPSDPDSVVFLRSGFRSGQFLSCWIFRLSFSFGSVRRIYVWLLGLRFGLWLSVLTKSSCLFVPPMSCVLCLGVCLFFFFFYIFFFVVFAVVFFSLVSIVFVTFSLGFGECGRPFCSDGGQAGLMDVLSTIIIERGWTWRFGGRSAEAQLPFVSGAAERDA